MDAVEYRSPLRKLVRFFQKSRDGWKEKSQQGKVVIKRLTNRMYAMKRSRDRWKTVAKRQRQELQELRRQLETQKTRSQPTPAARWF